MSDLGYWVGVDRKRGLKPSIYKDPEKYLSAPPILWHLLTCIVYKGNVNAFPGIQENPPE